MDNHLLIHLSDASLRYKDGEQPIFDGLDLQIPKHKWTCILGKSGCGKTSLLRFLAGLLSTHIDWSGNLRHSFSSTIGEHVSYMAQQDLLMPWLNVFDNVCLSLKFGHNQITQTDKDKAVQLIKQVGLLQQINLFPQQLSGGMRQRVALARTLMQDKPLVLMDEPFSALDAVTRHQLQNLSTSLLHNKTVILITHDPQEALRLSHQIILMQGHPSVAHSFPTPSEPPPRKIYGEIAVMQQQLIEQLEKEYA